MKHLLRRPVKLSVSRKILRHIPFTLLLIFSGMVFAECPSSIDEQLSILFTGSLAHAKQAANCISTSEYLPYGSSPIHIRVIVGDPGHINEQGNEMDFYYKTATGPYWFVFIDNKLIKKDLLLPGRWRGTDEELESLWGERESNTYWYIWDAEQL